MQAQSLQQQLGMGALTGATGLDQATLDALRIGAGMSPGATSIQAPTTFGQAMGGALAQQSAQMFGQGIQGLFNPSTPSTGSFSQNAGIYGQTGYTGGVSGVLSGDEWANF